MKLSTRILSSLSILSVLCVPIGSFAEDIDIFTGLAGSTAGKPNILFVLDNTSNWARAAQKWPGGLNQGQAEVRAIKSLVGESNVSSNVNFGLMEFVTNGNANDIGGVVRFPISSMTDANKTVFSAQLDQIFGNITSPTEKRNTGTPYGTLLYDVRNYLTGNNTVWAKTSTPSDLVGTTQGSNGYTTNYTKFRSPLDATDNCGRTFMVFIGNPSSSGPTTDDAANKAALVALGGDASSLALPLFTTAPSSVSSTFIGYTPSCVASASACTPAADYPAACDTGGTYDFCSCQDTNVLKPPKAVLSCGAGLSSFIVQSGALVTTAGATSCAASAPTADAAAAAAATPALTCPPGATCSYTVVALTQTTCSGTNPTPTSGTTSCLTSAPAANVATATSVGLSCPSGSTCNYSVDSGSNCPPPAPTSGATVCLAAAPTANAVTAAAATPALSCPAGSACSYAVDAGTACSSPTVSSASTACLAAAPLANVATATSAGLSCPAGATCSYSLDAGTTCTTPAVSAGTTACLTPAAAPTADAAGGALAGLTCPSGFTCSYAVSAPILPQCGAPPTVSGTTTACLAAPPAADATGGILAGLTCPSGSACAYTVDSSTACSSPAVSSGTACLASAPSANAAGATLVGLSCPANTSCAYSVATGAACGSSGNTNGTTGGLVSAPAATAGAAGARAGLTCPASATCTYSVGSGTNTAATTAATSYLAAAPTCTNGAASCTAGGATLTCPTTDAAGSAVSCNYSVSLLATASVTAAAPVTTGTLVTLPTCTNGAASCTAGGVTSTCPANATCTYAVSAGTATAASTGTTGYLSSMPTANAATAALAGLTCPSNDSSGATVTCSYSVALASTATGAGSTGETAGPAAGYTNYTKNCYSAVGTGAGQWNLATTTDFGPFVGNGGAAFPTCTPSNGCTYVYTGVSTGSTSEGTGAGSGDNCGSGTALIRMKQVRTAMSTYTVTMTPNTKTHSITQTATPKSTYTLSMTPNTKTYPVTQTATSAFNNYTVTQTPTAYRQYTMTQTPTLVSGTNTYTVTQTPAGAPKRYLVTQTPTAFRSYTVTQTPALSPQTKTYSVTQTPTLIPTYSYPVRQAATTWTDVGNSTTCTATSGTATTAGYSCGNLGCRIDGTRTSADSGTACGAGTLSYPVFGDIPGDQVVTPTGQYLTTANTWYADEWAKFLHNASIASPTVVYYVAGPGAITAGSGGADGKFDLKFTGGTGTPATGTFTVVGGKLTEIAVLTLGTYSTAPTAFDFSNSAGLTGTAAIVTGTSISQITGRGAITAGSGGTNGTFALGFTGGSGTNAKGTFTVAGGKLTELAITSGGTYVTLPSAFDFSASAGLTGASASLTTAAIDLSKGGGVTTYSIDVFNAQQNAQQTQLLMSMAQQGGGRYYQAKSEQEILNALRNILAEIQSVNTSFAAASIPLSTSNRARNLSEVYIGMFRADPSAGPRWLGNMKKYKLGKIDGVERLLDKFGIDAGNSQTGFINECATSDWTTDSGAWWKYLNQPITPSPQSECTAMPVGNTSEWSDMPDGSSVEKGAVAEVLRKGNDPATTNATPTWEVNRTIKSRSGSTFTVFPSGDGKVYDFTRGVDVNDIGSHTAEQNYAAIISPAPTNPTRPSIHGDVVHSRPLAVDYGSAYEGVTVYYGANDGTLRAVSGLTGKERWAFIPPEFDSRLKRLESNLPLISYPNVDPLLVPTPAPKDYFFDGSTGLRQNIDNTKVWIYPTQRRGGRMVYGIDVSNPNVPVMKWRQGCPTHLMTNPGSGELCTAGFENIGQTWATPIVVRVKGYSSSVPVVIVGGGYDTCEDQQTKSPSCSGTKGNLVYIIDSDTGALLKTLPTRRAVTADVSTIDLNGDGFADYAYVVDLGGNIYRISFIKKPSDPDALDKDDWSIKRVAYANSDSGGRKFMFAPALVAAGSTGIYLALGSGDRERPLYRDYPFATVVNRAYAYLDKPDQFDEKDTVSPVDDAKDICSLDGSTAAVGACIRDLTTATTCDSEKLTLASSTRAWRVNLEKPGEQTVTPAIVIGGMVVFNTNRPLPPAQATCNLSLGEGGGYFLNLLNASGAVAVQGNCSSTINGANSNRRATFVAGIGFPTPPVMVNIPGEDPICIGCANKDTGIGGKLFDPIKVSPDFSAQRSRKYRYQEIDE